MILFEKKIFFMKFNNVNYELSFINLVFNTINNDITDKKFTK